MSKPRGAGGAARIPLAFLAGGGEVGALMRARDWSGSPLGKPSGWPQSLRSVVGLLLTSRFPMFLAWGPELSLLYNDPYAEILGAKHPGALGARFRDAWGEIWPDISPLVDAALRGEATFREDLPLVMNRKGFPEQTWFTFSYSPVRDKGGAVAGMFCTCAETTGAVLAQRRGALLAEVGEVLVRAEDPREAMRAAAELLGRHLGASRTGFGEVEADGATVVLGAGWAQGVAPLEGAFPLDGFGPEAIARQRRGETRWSDDVAADPAQDPGVWAAIETRAFASVPLVREGRLKASLFVNFREPHRWTADELTLIEEVAARAWAAVERARARDELRRSEARYRTLFEAIDAGFCTVEVRLDAPDGAGGQRIDYRVVEANPAFYRQTGFPPAVLGRWLREAAPLLEEHWFETYGRIARTGEPAHVEQRSEFLGRWFDVYAFRVGGPGEGRVAILFNDVSARRDGEARLRELNETLEARVAETAADLDRVWRNAGDMFVVIDGDGAFQRVNPATAAILGWTEAELLGRTVFDFVHPDDVAATLGALERARGDVLPTFENRYRHKDGGLRTISWVASPEGGLIYAYGRDVSAERARQAELEAAQEQLRQSQKMESVGQLTGGLAHDFNNLLAGISGSLEMMASRIAQGRHAEVERYVAAAQGAAKRAAALTHRLLAFSRRQTLDPRPTDVNALVRGMEDLIRRTAGPTVSLEVVGAAGLWPALVDASQLENALLNLCINARDAMPGGGRITVETANRWLDARTAREQDMEPGQYLSLCVTDTGTGMTPEVLAKAFDPFFTTKPLGEGTGLGLSMIYGFAKQSGGQVRIYSELGEGTTVCLYLPRHDAPADEAPEPAAPPAGPAGASRDGRTVLVVDDEPTVRMLLADILQELGCIAIEAADGEAGLRVLRSDGRLDLLVTDVGLPGSLNGRQLADAARLLRPDLPVLLITGYAENAVLSAGSLGPGMAVLTKPFGVDAVSARIREMVGRG